MKHHKIFLFQYLHAFYAQNKMRGINYRKRNTIVLRKKYVSANCKLHAQTLLKRQSNKKRLL